MSPNEIEKERRMRLAPRQMRNIKKLAEKRGEPQDTSPKVLFVEAVLMFMFVGFIDLIDLGVGLILPAIGDIITNFIIAFGLGTIFLWILVRGFHIPFTYFIGSGIDFVPVLGDWLPMLTALVFIIVIYNSPKESFFGRLGRTIKLVKVPI